MEELITNCWPRSDKEMVEVTLPEYLDKQPFNLYYMSVSGHSTYGPGNAMGAKNIDKVDYSATQLQQEEWYINARGIIVSIYDSDRKVVDEFIK
jgi:hypothetical protein